MKPTVESTPAKRGKFRAPSKAVNTGGVAGSITIVIVWIAQSVWPSIDVPATVHGAVTVIVSYVAAWIAPDPDRRPPAKHLSAQVSVSETHDQ